MFQRKHKHDFDNWVQTMSTVPVRRYGSYTGYDESGEVIVINGKVAEHDVDMQERTCRTCGFVQRVRV